MKKIITIFIVATLLLTVGFVLFHNGRIEVTMPTRGKAVKAVYGSGMVEATSMLPLSSKFTAKLMELNVDEGSHVKKDQQLARLESTDLEYTIQDLKAKEAFTKGEYERDVTLYNKKVIAKEGLEKSMADYKSAQAARMAAESQNSYNTLYAPADGLIIKRDGEIGQLIQANQAIFWFSGNSDLRITADIDEEDIALVAPGQKVLIQSDAFQDQVFHGKVHSVTQKGDPVARTFRVRITFDGEVPFMIGMNVETNIIISESENALLIPTSAVQDEHLWAVEDGVVKKIKIKVGAKNLDKVEVIDGLTDKSVVVIAYDKQFEDGQKVKTRTK